MELSIAVNSYKNSELLRLCLKSIKKNTSGADYELIVTDSETEEDTEILMREEFPDVKFFPFQKNVGFQAMINKAGKESSGKYILFLNSDILVTENSVRLMLDFIRSNPDIGILAPQLLNFNGTFQPSCFRFYLPVTILYRRTFLKKFKIARRHLDWFLMKDCDHKNPKDVDWVMGSSMLVSAKALAEVGPMDPIFFMYMEDVDWCRRFWEKGWRVVYFPPAKMHHYHSRGSDKGGFLRSIFFNKLTWIHIVSAFKYFKKYWGKEIPRHG